MGLIHVPEGRKLFPNLTVRDNLELGSYRRGKNNRSVNLEKVLEIFPKLSERISQTLEHFRAVSSRWLLLAVVNG